MKYLCALIFLLIGAPLAQAVSISEVAWMGDSVSANHEWIELFNADGAVVVEGWTLSDGMNLVITLTGEIPASGYVVLERTSDESAPGSAFLVYTGALVNTGATLTLRTAAGEVVDQVAGGEDWKNIGGDNVTKETAQYSAQGWLTAPATPGAQHSASSEVVSVSTTTTTSGVDTTVSASTNSSHGSRATVPVVPTVPELAFTVAHQRVAYVGQPVRFTGESNYATKESKRMRYVWNFGDATTASGTEVWHTYHYPGEYVVTTFVRKGQEERVERSAITVLPVSVSVSFGIGVVHLHNNAPYDIDVSGYSVEAEKQLRFPSYSIIETGGTVTFGGSMLGSWREGVVVRDRAGVVVVQMWPTAVGDQLDDSVLVSEVVPSPASLQRVVLEHEVPAEKQVVPTSTITIAAHPAADIPNNRTSSLVVLAITLVVLTNLFGYVVVRRPAATSEIPTLPKAG